MSKGRRKIGPTQAPSSLGPPKAPPAPGVEDKSPPARPRSFGSRFARPAVIAVVGITVAGLLAKWAWPRSIDVRVPSGLDRAGPDVRAYLQSRIDRARESPRDAGRQAGLGLALAANGFWRDARHAFEQAAYLDPDDPLPAYYIARADIEAADYENARKDLETVLDRFPKFAPAHYAMGSVLLDGGSFDAAAERFRKLMSLEGEHSIWGRLGLANALLQQGKAAEAAALLEPVVRREPTLAAANYLLGNAYRALKQLDLANRHLVTGVGAKAITMPDDWSVRLDEESRTVGARIGVAQGLHDRGKTNEAISLLAELRRSYPDNLDLLSNLGAFYLGINQNEKARDVLLDAERLNASHIPTLFNLIVAEIRLKTLESALRHSGRAVELAPTHHHAYLVHADVLSEMNRLVEALDALRQAVRLDPRNANLRVRMGALLVRSERAQDAKAELDTAVQIDPSNAEAWMVLCEASLNLKLENDARVAFDQARRLAPNAPQLQTLARRIQALGGR